MTFLKIVIEYCNIQGKFASFSKDLLITVEVILRWLFVGVTRRWLSMANNLLVAVKALSLEDDEPITLPDSPRFKVFDENSTSLLGRLLNPDCQSMSRMIEDMPRVWRVYDKVRGIALSRDKLQFIFQREEDLQTVFKDRPCLIIIGQWFWNVGLLHLRPTF